MDTNISKRAIRVCFYLHIENQSKTSYGKIERISAKGRWNFHWNFKTACCILSSTPFRKDSHHRETTQSVNTANKSNILSMIGVLTERYFRPDLRSKKIKLITRTNPTTKSTKKQTLNKTTIFYNEVGNKSASGKYFVKFCVCVITIGLLFSVISTFIVPLGM